LEENFNSNEGYSSLKETVLDPVISFDPSFPSSFINSIDIDEKYEQSGVFQESSVFQVHHLTHLFQVCYEFCKSDSTSECGIRYDVKNYVLKLVDETQQRMNVCDMENLDFMNRVVTIFNALITNKVKMKIDIPEYEVSTDDLELAKCFSQVCFDLRDEHQILRSTAEKLLNDDDSCVVSCNKVKEEREAQGVWEFDPGEFNRFISALGNDGCFSKNSKFKVDDTSVCFHGLMWMCAAVVDVEKRGIRFTVEEKIYKYMVSCFNLFQQRYNGENLTLVQLMDQVSGVLFLSVGNMLKVNIGEKVDPIDKEYLSNFKLFSSVCSELGDEHQILRESVKYFLDDDKNE
jgi:hypothetical protein